MTARDRAAKLSENLSGLPPEGIWSAPGRVNLIGEHTDYNEGFVLPFAIPQRTYAAVRQRDDGRIRVASTLAEMPVDIALEELERRYPLGSGTTPAADPAASWAAYPLGVAWAMIQAGATPSGVDIALASDVPVGAGLSSSAAIEGACATALNELWQAGFDRPALARIGRRAENEAVGAPTGIMDQMASMLGEEDAAIFLDCRTLEATVVPLGLAAAGLAVLVIDTGVRHDHATGGYRQRRDACDRGAAALGLTSLRELEVSGLGRAEDALDAPTFRRVRHVVTENHRVCDVVRTLRERGPREIGPLLISSHASMRDDFDISTPELDTAVDAALRAGALGARMTGGGFGGAAIALVEQDAVDAVSAAVAKAFTAAGFASPRVFPAPPSAGAFRETESA